MLLSLYFEDFSGPVVGHTSAQKVPVVVAPEVSQRDILMRHISVCTCTSKTEVRWKITCNGMKCSQLLRREKPFLSRFVVSLISLMVCFNSFPRELFLL
jgi:hypothetical protein